MLDSAPARAPSLSAIEPWTWDRLPACQRYLQVDRSTLFQRYWSQDRLEAYPTDDSVPPLGRSNMAKTKKTTRTASQEASSPAAAKPDSAARWTFLTNHAHVLILLDADPHLVLREVARRVGITERAVQKIIHDLEDGGFIERERVGRQNHYRVLQHLPLRHPIEAHRKIGDLLQLIGDPDAFADQEDSASGQRPA